MKYVYLFLGCIILLSCVSDNSTDATQLTTTIDTISTADNPVDLVIMMRCVLFLFIPKNYFLQGTFFFEISSK